MIRTRELSIPAGTTVGVLSALGVTPQGAFEVHLLAGSDLVFSEDAAGSVTGPAVGSRIVRVHNSDIFVKHSLASGSPRVLGVLVSQQ